MLAVRRRYTRRVRAEDLRAWVQARRAAEARERMEASRAAPSDDPVQAGLGLIALAGRLHGWPVPEDPVTAREDVEVYATWATLRRRCRP
jgi:hypothetical protein